MANTLNTRIRNKRDTSANWETKNPVLLNGEMILVDTNAGELRVKIGDGVKTYTQLPFIDETIKSQLSGKLNKTDVDTSLNIDSTNPVQNKVIARKLNEIKSYQINCHMVYSMPNVLNSSEAIDLTTELSGIIGSGDYYGWKIRATANMLTSIVMFDSDPYFQADNLYIIYNYTYDSTFNTPIKLTAGTVINLQDVDELYVYSTYGFYETAVSKVLVINDLIDTTIFKNDLWLLNKGSYCEEYLFLPESGRFELIGSSKVDLSNYYTKPEVNGTIGDLTALKTQEKSNIVDAINESITYCDVTFEASAIAEMTDEYVKFAVTTEQLNLIDSNFIVKFNVVPLNIALVGYKQFGSIADRDIQLVYIAIDYTGCETSMHNLRLYQDEDDNWYLTTLLRPDEYTTYALTKERIQNDIIGDNTTLNTTSKDNLVNAINEINSKTGLVTIPVEIISKEGSGTAARMTNENALKVANVGDFYISAEGQLLKASVLQTYFSEEYSTIALNVGQYLGDSSLYGELWIFVKEGENWDTVQMSQNTLNNEEWEFELEDGSTVTKKIAIWES